MIFSILEKIISQYSNKLSFSHIVPYISGFATTWSIGGLITIALANTPNWSNAILDPSPYGEIQILLLISASSYSLLVKIGPYLIFKLCFFSIFF